MNERPPQPPEGRLIAAAARARGLSIREASRRAGISYGRWRQIVSGVQNVSPGSYAAVRAPAATLARMAQAAGVTPESLATEGNRPDAAEIMRSASLRIVPPARGTGPGDPAAQVLADLLGRYADDGVVQAIGAQHGKEARIRVNEILEWLSIRSSALGNGTSG